MKTAGFTLAELLIALAILGLIATFTIPKVLTSQASAKEKAIAKEAIAAVVGAYQVYSQSNTPSAATSAKDLTPYLNYVRIDTTKTEAFDYPYGTVGDCEVNNPCVYLHNGAVMQMYNSHFAGTATTNIVWFLVDPDSSKTASPQGGGIEVALYYNGRVATAATLAPNSVCDWGTYNPNLANDPAWFNWN